MKQKLMICASYPTDYLVALQHVRLLDDNITPSDAHDTHLLGIQGSITRAGARQFNLEVSLYLSTFFL